MSTMSEEDSALNLSGTVDLDRREVTLHTRAAAGGIRGMIEVYMDEELLKRGQSIEALGMERALLITHLLARVGEDQERAWNPKLLTANYDAKAISESVGHYMDELLDALQPAIDGTKHLPQTIQNSIRVRAIDVLLSPGLAIKNGAVAVAKFVRECLSTTLLS